MQLKGRIIKFLALAVFLAAHFTVVLHTADFGPQEHQHHGAACDIQLFSEHAKTGSLPVAPAVQTPAVPVAALLPAAREVLFTGANHSPSLPRAPPASFLKA